MMQKADVVTARRPFRPAERLPRVDYHRGHRQSSNSSSGVFQVGVLRRSIAMLRRRNPDVSKR